MRDPQFTYAERHRARRLSLELFEGRPIQQLLPVQMEALLVRLVDDGMRPWPSAYLRSLNYRTGYLRSAWWLIRRRVAILRAGHKCEQCGVPYEEVHHLTYENLGDERDEDLAVLCGRCHAKEHGWHPEPEDTEASA